MAIAAFKGKLLSDGLSASASVAYPSTSDVNTSAAAIVYTTFASALATLVSDGASPTQAHVTAVNSAWTTLKALIDATVALAPSAVPSGNITVNVDLASIATATKLHRVFTEILRAGVGSGQLTP